MQIKADKEAEQAIQQLCDIALRHGGLANLVGINRVLQALETNKPTKAPNSEKK